MTPDPSRRPVSPAQATLSRWWARHGAQLGLCLGAAVLAGMLGYGLATSAAAQWPGNTGLLGALVGAGVAVLLMPLALWARLPTLPLMRLLRQPPPPDAPAAPVLHLPQRSAAQGASVAAAGSAALGQLFQQGAAARAQAFEAEVGVASSLAGAAPAGNGIPGFGGGTGPGQLADAALAEASRAHDAQRPARDALTGAYTQQHFVAAADREWSRIRRHGEDAALLMIDIDRLKGINERHGEPCGDALLVEITRQVSTTLRQYDLLARFGGGVLVVYLPHTDPIGALDVAERIRERVAALRVSWQTHTVRSTVSVGVAGIGASHAALDEVIAEAGAALREAKAAGRNCVRAAPIPPRRNANLFPAGAQRPIGPT